jgi:two-component system sensor histidine kinase MprB
MSFRLRLTVLAALAVAVALVGASFVVYFTDRSELIGQIDSDLRESLTLPRLASVVGGPGAAGNPTGLRLNGAQGGAVLSRPPKLPVSFRLVLPRSSAAVQVHVGPARTRGNVHRSLKTVATAPKTLFTTKLIKNVPIREFKISMSNVTITISRPLVEVERNLSHLRWLLFLICIGGTGIAAILGALVSGRALAPLRRLTETTERIIDTGDLRERIGHRGRDEISRLSARLDELLATLEVSLRTQRQLVADASHELRTPIATLRANFELLTDPRSLDSKERGEVAADVHDELESISLLVGELIELARGEELDVTPCEFRLDEVVRAAVDRVAKHAPDLSFRTRLEPSVVTGVPERVDRAVANLLDNARKWSPTRETVDVAVERGVVEVRDRGPGIAAEDVPLVFNRFYRSARARAMPGAGLGLAIVKQIADAHGGSVTVDQAPDGGAIVRLRLSATS